jgi:DNA-binding XRE family transcriptional regulator
MIDNIQEKGDVILKSKQKSKFNIVIKLNTVRIKKGLTTKQLANLSGISEKDIILIERGKKNPVIDTIVILALALKVKPSELYNIEMEQ